VKLLLWDRSEEQPAAAGREGTPAEEQPGWEWVGEREEGTSPRRSHPSYLSTRTTKHSDPLGQGVAQS
jgi:hypothetical protein